MSVENDTTNGTFRCAAEIAVIGTVHIVILFTAIIGNIAVICAISKSDKLQDEPSSLFLVNLAITDLSSAVIVMGSAFLSLALDTWPFGWVWCYIVCMVNYLLIIVSMLTLCFISIDRYFAIIHPLQYIVKMTRGRILLLIAYAWFQGFVFSIVPVLFRWIEYDYWEYVCAIEWHKQRQEAIYYVVMAFMCCFLFPGLILIVSYCRVLKVAHKTSRTNTEMSVPRGKRQKYSTSYKCINSLLIVIVMYFVCMMPFSMTKLYKVASKQNNILPGYVNLLSSLIGYLSSAVNPLIYAIFRKDFRHAYKQIFRKFIIRSRITKNSTTAESSFGPSDF